MLGQSNTAHTAPLCHSQYRGAWNVIVGREANDTLLFCVHLERKRHCLCHALRRATEEGCQRDPKSPTILPASDASS